MTRAVVLTAIVCFAAFAALAEARLGASDPSIVNAPAGSFRGNVKTKSRSFLGVPFAAPPVGSLRWQKPQPHPTWSGVRNATWYGNSCMQHSNAFTLLTKTSEDCLYLNVYTPYPVPSSPLPVMIFFYGGSWDTGSASFFLYNPEADESLVEDVVFVTVNYRLNSFGFLASDSLRAESGDNSVGNYGFLDQRFAMQWVKHNIAAFGGNPSLVTIFGESAGAGSVSNHLLSPGSQGLFHRAMMESGPVADWTSQTFNTSVVKFEAIAKKTGCCPAGNAACSSDPTVIACMRGIDQDTLESASGGLVSGVLEWSPVIDGVDVIDNAEKLAAEGKIANVPTLFGSNADEGTMFTKAKKDLSCADYSSFLLNRYGSSLGSSIMKEYPCSNYPNGYWAASHALGDSQMTCPVRRTAKWMASAREAHPNPAPVYTYFYNHTLEVVKLFLADKGCFHGSELAMVFDFEIALWTDAEKALAKAFVRYWTNFAKTGNPNGDGLPNWPAFTMATQQTAVLDVDSIVTPAAHFRDDLCEYWDNTTVPPSLIWG